MSPRNAESAPPDLPHSDQNQIPMPRFRRSPEHQDTELRRRPASVPASTPSTQPSPRKPEVAAPLPWPLRPVQELNKLRMLLQEERAKSAERHAGPVIATPPTAPPAPKAIEPAARVIIEAAAEPVPVSTLQTESAPLQKIAEPAASVIVETAPELVLVLTPQTEPAPIQSEPRWFQSKLETAKRQANAFRSESRRRLLEARSFARQLWARRVRIRLATRAPLQNIVSGPIAVCRAAANAVRQNVRLVNSLTMAMLSALLALGLILAVRHYDPAGQDAARSAATSGPAPAAPIKVVSAKSDGATAKLDRPKTVQDASKKPAPVVQAADRKTIRRQAPRRGNDNYVAPDTYVYYGKR